VDSKLIALLHDLDDGIDVGKVYLRGDSLGVEIQSQGD
jgi:hypothetical protein